MGIYAEYLAANMTRQQLSNERKKQLRRIKSIRGRDVLVLAADISKNAPNGISYGDLQPFYEQLSSLKTRNLDIILETPGGDAVVVEDMVKRIREKFNKFGVIVPGSAKSAGTIFAMAADEILMSKDSSLGPIDAQVVIRGHRFSAGAFLEGIESIKHKVDLAGRLDPVYIPILCNVSPGDIQHCENAQAFSQELVSKWLSEYKFKNWTNHSDGSVVSESDKKKRANEIAEKLADHNFWLTHSRSIHINDLEAMKLKIVNFDGDTNLGDALRRYQVLLQLSFEGEMYKIFETCDNEIGKKLLPAKPGLKSMPEDCMCCRFTCPKCGSPVAVQVNFKANVPLRPGMIQMPAGSNKIRCTKCDSEIDIAGLRQKIEGETGRLTV